MACYSISNVSFQEPCKDRGSSAHAPMHQVFCATFIPVVFSTAHASMVHLGSVLLKRIDAEAIAAAVEPTTSDPGRSLSILCPMRTLFHSMSSGLAHTRCSSLPLPTCVAHKQEVSLFFRDETAQLMRTRCKVLIRIKLSLTFTCELVQSPLLSLTMLSLAFARKYPSAITVILPVLIVS